MKHRVGFTDDELLRIVPLLHKVALSRTRCRDKASDLVQNTVLRMLDKKYQFEAGTVLGAWGVVIMHRLWVQQCRRARREIKLFRPILTGRDGNTEFEIDLKKAGRSRH
jgi:DNA-directed RNA polymerase specialized sigma24 family protein